MPTYFRHEHYSSFQRQLNNVRGAASPGLARASFPPPVGEFSPAPAQFGYNKLHKSSSPQNSVYVRIKGEQLTDMDPVELLQLRPVLERSTLRRAKRSRRKGDKKAGKKATTPPKKVAGPATTPVRVSPTSPPTRIATLGPGGAEEASESKVAAPYPPQCPGAPRRPAASPLLGHLGADAPPVALLPSLDGGHHQLLPGLREAAVLLPGSPGGGGVDALAEGYAHYHLPPGLAVHLAPASPAQAPVPRRPGQAAAHWAVPAPPGASSFLAFQRKPSPAHPQGGQALLPPGLYATPLGAYPPFSIVVSHDATFAPPAGEATTGGGGRAAAADPSYADGRPHDAVWPAPEPPAPTLPHEGGLFTDGGGSAFHVFSQPPSEPPSRPHSPDGHWRANLFVPTSKTETEPEDEGDAHIFPDDFSDIFPPDEVLFM